MLSFLSKKQLTIILAVVVICAAGYLFYAIAKIRENLSVIKPTSQAHLIVRPPAPPPTVPEIPPPIVSFEINKDKKQSSVTVRWGNLPETATKLDIFISKKNLNQWSLWQTIELKQGELAGGSATFNVNSALAGGGYDFYAQASGNVGGGSSGTPLWTSSSTQATYSTSTSSGGTPPPPPPPPGPPAPPPSPPPAGNPPPPPPSPSPSPENPNGVTYYYTPQQTIAGTSTAQTGTFWAQHVNNTIEVGWQNLPANATEITIFRAPSSTGPWTQILDQKNPETQSYSIGLIDNSLDETFYYKMDVLNGNANIGTYGPVELPPI